MSTREIENIVKKGIQISPGSGCHIWKYSETHSGYGYVTLAGCNFTVRRIVWWLKHGYLPKGEHMRDTCGHKMCCNIEHLSDNTPLEDRRETLFKPNSRRHQPAITEKQEDWVWEQVILEGASIYSLAQKLGVSWKAAKKGFKRAENRINS